MGEYRQSRKNENLARSKLNLIWVRKWNDANLSSHQKDQNKSSSVEIFKLFFTDRVKSLPLKPNRPISECGDSFIAEAQVVM